MAYCFKANSAILNALLTILEERLFHDGTAAHRTPLLTLVGASNELPEDESLAALHDRFLLRFWTDYLQDDDNFVDLLDPAFDPTTKVTATISLEELAHLQAKVRTVTVSREIRETMLAIRRDLAADGVVASDRRWKAAIRGLQAKALLEGRDHVVTSDLLLLINILWETRDELAKVRDVVGQAADPILADALELADDAKATLKDIRDQAPQDASSLDDRLAFVKVIMEGSGSLKATTDAIYSRLGRSGMTLDTATPEVQEAMGSALRTQEELERMAMAYSMGQVNGVAR